MVSKNFRFGLNILATRNVVARNKSLQSVVRHSSFTPRPACSSPLLLPPPPAAPQKLFTADELSTFNGKAGRPMYLSILGQVFDVSKGQRYYGVSAALQGLFKVLPSAVHCWIVQDLDCLPTSV